MRIFVRAAEVATMTGFASANTFLANRTRLEADHQFPLPMPGHTSPLIWKRSEVASWVAMQGRPRSLNPAALGDGGNVVLMQEARRP